jgi:hypothetical protein
VSDGDGRFGREVFRGQVFLGASRTLNDGKMRLAIGHPQKRGSAHVGEAQTIPHDWRQADCMLAA